MSWAQLSNRPNNVSPVYHNNTQHHTYAKPINTLPHSHIATTNNIYNIPPPKVATTSSKRKHSDINYVILDSGAFIGRQSFFNNFNPNVCYYMTPAVHHEIRDKQSRQFLDNFPFEIIVKKAEPQSLQFVAQFITKHRNLKSMSKVDRHIIALAHSLEITHEGTKHVSTLKKKEKKAAKAMSVTDNKKHIKKSKTGRIHSQMVPLKDSGVRLSKLKKVIPFSFDDFMTMNKEEYGIKYGKPTLEMIKETKDDEEKIKYNPNIKAMTECNEDEDEDESNIAISKSQRRRKRKKLMKNNKNNEDQEKSEIEKMIEEDLKTTFNETASLISSLSAQSNRQLKPVMESAVRSTPSTGNGHETVRFGTMFNGANGTLFDTHGLPPLKQNKATKKTVSDAWNGEWLTPDNFKAIPKNVNAKKKKLKNAEESQNSDSSVAVITVDKAMQRCMVEMGLRVLTTSRDRQYGGGNGLNGEPIDYIFRCYGCFQFEHNTTRTNCRWCGGQTFQRVAIYEDAAGKHHYRYYYRDRYGHRYLDKHQLVPRGSQLVKYKQNDYQNNNNYQRNEKKKKKKRSGIGYNNNNKRW